MNHLCFELIFTLVKGFIKPFRLPCMSNANSALTQKRTNLNKNSYNHYTAPINKNRLSDSHSNKGAPANGLLYTQQDRHRLQARASPTRCSSYSTHSRQTTDCVRVPSSAVVNTWQLLSAGPMPG